MKEALREVLGKRHLPANPYHALAEHFRTIEIRCAQTGRVPPVVAATASLRPADALGRWGRSEMERGLPREGPLLQTLINELSLPDGTRPAPWRACGGRGRRADAGRAESTGLARLRSGGPWCARPHVLRGVHAPSLETLVGALRHGPRFLLKHYEDTVDTEGCKVWGRGPLLQSHRASPLRSPCSDPYRLRLAQRQRVRGPSCAAAAGVRRLPPRLPIALSPPITRPSVPVGRLEVSHVFMAHGPKPEKALNACGRLLLQALLDSTACGPRDTRPTRRRRALTRPLPPPIGPCRRDTRVVDATLTLEASGRTAAQHWHMDAIVSEGAHGRFVRDVKGAMVGRRAVTLRCWCWLRLPFHSQPQCETPDPPAPTCAPAHPPTPTPSLCWGSLSPRFTPLRVRFALIFSPTSAASSFKVMEPHPGELLALGVFLDARRAATYATATATATSAAAADEGKSTSEEEARYVCDLAQPSAAVEALLGTCPAP